MLSAGCESRRATLQPEAIGAVMEVSGKTTFINVIVHTISDADTLISTPDQCRQVARHPPDDRARRPGTTAQKAAAIT